MLICLHCWLSFYFLTTHRRTAKSKIYHSDPQDTSGVNPHRSNQFPGVFLHWGPDAGPHYTNKKTPDSSCCLIKNKSDGGGLFGLGLLQAMTCNEAPNTNYEAY